MTTAQLAPQIPVRVIASDGFTGFLAEHDVSLAFTTGGQGIFGVLAARPDGQLASIQHPFGHCTGPTTATDGIWVAAADQLVGYAARPATDGVHDVSLTPTESLPTGPLQTHEIAVNSSGEVLFCNTAHNSVSMHRPPHGFTEIWRPPFVAGDGPEDRCHLNGLAVTDGKLRLVTCLGETDEPGGWRRNLARGCLVDVLSNELLASGLWLPHSPRIHHDTTWLLESGTGTLGTVGTHGYTPEVELPGFTRGLDFVEGYAVVGLSMPWRARTHLPLVDRLQGEDISPMCGLAVVDLSKGDIAHWARVDTPTGEVFDVRALRHVRYPAVIQRSLNAP